ncbi:MAG: endolytic transglycosylase MltG [Myxococcota bacterium]
MSSVSAFIEAARDPKLMRELSIPGRSAEGFLYPETYRMAVGLSARDIVTLMVEQFRAVQNELGVELEGEALWEWVTLGSLVEREVRSPLEMPRVAGVFRNRLARNMRLESCATVQYILGEPKEKLTFDDVRLPHPYNTYLHYGLPPGPIASPGRDALAAAAGPDTHDYLFFVAREDGSGRHLFSKTYRQHLDAKARVARR